MQRLSATRDGQEEWGGGEEGAATWVAANRRAGRQHVLPLLQSAGDPSTLEVAKAKVLRGLHQAEFASLFHVPPDGHFDEHSQVKTLLFSDVTTFSPPPAPSLFMQFAIFALLCCFLVARD